MKLLREAEKISSSAPDLLCIWSNSEGCAAAFWASLLAGSCPLPLGCRNIQYLVKLLRTLCCISWQGREEQLQQEDQRAWEISHDLLGGACSSKLRFKSSGDTRNAIKCFEIGRNQILIFNLNKSSPETNIIFSALKYSRLT